MPVESQICEDGHVSYFKITDPWTLEELFQGFGQATAHRDEIHQKFPTRKVHPLIDLMLTNSAPPGVMQGRKLPSLNHATRGEIVFAVKNEFPRTIGKAMLKVMHVEGHFFDSLDEAWAFLRTTIQKEPG